MSKTWKEYMEGQNTYAAQFPQFIGNLGDRDTCARCKGTRKVRRPKTADHILTDTEPWEWCPDCVSPEERGA